MPNAAARRWQFTLRGLLAATFVAGLATATFSGAFGGDVQQIAITGVGAMLLLLMGVAVYLLLLIALASPALLAFVLTKLVWRMIKSRELARQSGGSNQSE